MNKVLDIPRDYSLVGKETEQAMNRGLAEASWYASPIGREDMKGLMERRNWPGIRDSFIWFGLLGGGAALTVMLWGTWWFLLPYMVYAVIYGSSSDSRWHEAGHGTAFKSSWMNNVLYEIASFMMMRQSTVWRWSHTRHHSDTLVRGRDPEIAAQRPPSILKIFSNLFYFQHGPAELKRMLIHASGRIDKEVATFLPDSQYHRVYWTARIYLLIYLGAIAAAILLRNPLPVMFIGLPNLVGAWLMPVYGLTQHAGLEENVLDHRLNCRTVYMGRVHRFLYWNMNYHIEHHMFPMVPYHKLPALHKLMKDDCPTPYRSLWHAWGEIIPTLRKQAKNPSYFVKRELPQGAGRVRESSPAIRLSREEAGPGGLLRICSGAEIALGDLLRVDVDEQSYALYRTDTGKVFLSDGICTHGNTHLADGILMGEQVECPKHNGRFSVVDGSPQRTPVCEALRTYAVEEREGEVLVDVKQLVAPEAATDLQTFRVMKNNALTPYLTELVLEAQAEDMNYRPGDYIKLEIPPHKTGFDQFRISEAYRKTWKEDNAYRHKAFNSRTEVRNYSLARAPEEGEALVLNVRLALPPVGVNCDAGVGSSYVFGLKPGDVVRASGPHGDFHLRDSDRPLVFVGGGAGMAPLRSMISHLLEQDGHKGQVSYWYGARTPQDTFYTDYFQSLEQAHEKFSYTLAFSEQEDQLPEGTYAGFVHEVLDREFLTGHENPAACDYYLCGPPPMIEALQELLSRYGVPGEQVRVDAF